MPTRFVGGSAASQRRQPDGRGDEARLSAMAADAFHLDRTLDAALLRVRLVTMVPLYTPWPALLTSSATTAKIKEHSHNSSYAPILEGGSERLAGGGCGRVEVTKLMRIPDIPARHAFTYHVGPTIAPPASELVGE